MNDFEKMDQEWVKSTQDIREKKVSEGILKGFSTSVERRIVLNKQSSKRSFSPSFVPAMAVLIIASAVVLRSPMLSTPLAPISKNVDYAQLYDAENVGNEIAALKEMGVWTDEDDALLGENGESGMEDLELSNLNNEKVNLG